MISPELNALVCRELGLATCELTDETKAWEVPGWDSLSHIRILTAVETQYGFRIRGLEAMSLKQVGDLQRLIDRKTGKKA